MHAPRTTTSADGTPIAFEQTGAGEPLVLVEPAGHYRGFSAFEELRPQLAKHFCIYGYDRRGRGESEDASEYEPLREVEDLAAILSAIGRPAFVYGFSSSALLALHAAAHGLPFRKMALLEPPLQEPGARGTEAFEKMASIAPTLVYD